MDLVACLEQRKRGGMRKTVLLMMRAARYSIFYRVYGYCY